MSSLLSFDAPMLQPDELVDGRYRVLDRLGEGGQGTVYRALDEILRRPTALKTLTPGQAQRQLQRDRLFREAAALARLSHLNVAKVYTAGFHAGTPYVAMELVAGSSLASLIHEHARAGTQVALSRAFPILGGLARGLAAVHGAGLVHRDVKPDNVIVEESTGRVVLVDFGLAVSPEGADGAVVAGTPAYMAPELLSSTQVPGTAADVYAFGCVATELLTLAVPFDAGSVDRVLSLHARADRPSLRERRAELAGYHETIERCLAISPAARPTSCAAIADELDQHATAIHAASLRATLPPPSSAPAAAPSSRQRTTEPGSPDASAPAYAALHALVVDDDPIAGRVASRCVERAFAGVPVEVTVVRSASAARASARKHHPDLVVLDYLLPDGNGFDLLSHLRYEESASHAHVVVVTGNMEAVERWRFAILGVHDFVEKPARVSSFVAYLRSIARRRGWMLPESAHGSPT